ncbi:MAG: type II secretion system F family protein [Euryarchaeota archaeon]|nr:type II secretion system F family protein [Euryarchaeota archaeon]
MQRSARSNVHLRFSLQKAQIDLRPELYLSYSYMNMVIAFAASLLPILILAILVFAKSVVVPPVVFAVLVPLPMVLAFTIYLLTFVVPDIRASGRARDIDAKLPYALNYIATLASAGITPDKIFGSLARQPIYGEVANESAYISRDLTILGRDIVTALTAAIDRSPSVKFQDLLQGAITAIQSGSDLKNYFLTKSEQYVYENRQDQKKFIESLAVLAESYVTVVVAAPLLLIVLLTVMTAFGSGGRSAITIGYIMMLILLPVAQAGFAVTIKAITPEA